jgi:hypothetical protein
VLRLARGRHGPSAGSTPSGSDALEWRVSKRNAHGDNVFRDLWPEGAEDAVELLERELLELGLGLVEQGEQASFGDRPRTGG